MSHQKPYTPQVIILENFPLCMLWLIFRLILDVMVYVEEFWSSSPLFWQFWLLDLTNWNQLKLCRNDEMAVAYMNHKNSCGICLELSSMWTMIAFFSPSKFTWSCVKASQSKNNSGCQQRSRCPSWSPHPARQPPDGDLINIYWRGVLVSGDCIGSISAPICRPQVWREGTKLG